jgi:YbbR domain-containing protein
VTIRGPDTVDIDFKLKKDIKVIAEMLHHTFSSQDLEVYILLKQHNDDLFITVGVPRNGEYILRLLAKHQRSNMKPHMEVRRAIIMNHRD